jgi:hypothetical protein
MLKIHGKEFEIDPEQSPKYIEIGVKTDSLNHRLFGGCRSEDYINGVLRAGVELGAIDHLPDKTRSIYDPLIYKSKTGKDDDSAREVRDFEENHPELARTKGMEFRHQGHTIKVYRGILRDKGLLSAFDKFPGISLDWVILEEIMENQRAS